MGSFSESSEADSSADTAASVVTPCRHESQTSSESDRCASSVTSQRNFRTSDLPFFQLSHHISKRTPCLESCISSCFLLRLIIWQQIRSKFADANCRVHFATCKRTRIKFANSALESLEALDSRQSFRLELLELFLILDLASLWRSLHKATRTNLGLLHSVAKLSRWFASSPTLSTCLFIVYISDFNIFNSSATKNPYPKHARRDRPQFCNAGCKVLETPSTNLKKFRDFDVEVLTIQN